jgi:hypothetical protein
MVGVMEKRKERRQAQERRGEEGRRGVGFFYNFVMNLQASEQGHIQVVNTLVGLGANTKIHDSKNRIPLDVAKNEEIKKILT